MKVGFLVHCTIHLKLGERETSLDNIESLQIGGQITEVLLYKS